MERLEMRRTREYYEETPTKSARPRSSRIQAPRIPCFVIRVPCVFETDTILEEIGIQSLSMINNAYVAIVVDIY